MKDHTYDKLLIGLALLAPLLLMALSKWQYSLNTWYVPLNGDKSAYMSQSLEQNLRALPEVVQGSGVTLFFVSDRSCPCTRVTLNILQTAVKQANRKDLQLMIVDVNDPLAKTPAWTRILQQIPATPTLLVTEGQRLVYGGPVNSGSMCTTSVLKILGLSVLQSTSQKPVINWLQEGCYCPLKRVAASHSTRQ